MKASVALYARPVIVRGEQCAKAPVGCRAAPTSRRALRWLGATLAGVLTAVSRSVPRWGQLQEDSADAGPVRPRARWRAGRSFLGELASIVMTVSTRPITLSDREEALRSAVRAADGLMSSFP